MRVYYIILWQSTYSDEARNWTELLIYLLDGFVHGVRVGDVAFVCLKGGERYVTGRYV